MLIADLLGIVEGGNGQIQLPFANCASNQQLALSIQQLKKPRGAFPRPVVAHRTVKELPGAAGQLVTRAP
jgi:hypothetical protein